MITSQVEALKLDGDVLLADWEAAGLLHPSLLRLAKLASIDEELIDKAVGRLSAGDLAAARAAFRRVLRPGCDERPLSAPAGRPELEARLQRLASVCGTSP